MPSALSINSSMPYPICVRKFLPIMVQRQTISRYPMPKSAKIPTNNGANLGYQAELFEAADKLWGNMEPSDYKHFALGLIGNKFRSRHVWGRRFERI
jgi:hypothetical protein